jgi:hypothetical protein
MKNSPKKSDGPSGADAWLFDNMAAVEVAIHKQRRHGLREQIMTTFLAISA